MINANTFQGDFKGDFQTLCWSSFAYFYREKKSGVRRKKLVEFQFAERSFTTQRSFCFYLN